MGSPKLGKFLVLALLAGLVIFAEMPPARAADGNQALVNLTLKNVSVRDAIDKLFEGRGLKYEVEPGVTGKVVELTLRGITFDQALNAFADAAGLSCKIVNGVYVIRPTESGKIARDREQAPPQSEYAPPSVQAPLPPPLPASPGNSVMVESGPVFYAQPGGYGYPYYPPMYQAGNISVLGGYPYGPVIIGGNGYGYGGYLGGRSVYFPPPPGWVNPNILTLLRNRWALSPVRQYAPAWAY